MSARILHKSVKVEMMKRKGDQTEDNQTLNHTVFRVTSDDNLKLSAAHLADHVDENFGGLGAELSPILFTAFPFHLVFDQELKIIQVGIQWFSLIIRM